MSQIFTIQDFVGNRWAEAKEVLSKHDPALFTAIDGYASTDASRPSDPLNLLNLPEPSYRLGPQW
jgi:hypothetical protein